MSNEKLKEAQKIQRAELVLDPVLQSNKKPVGRKKQLIYNDNEPTGVQVTPF